MTPELKKALVALPYHQRRDAIQVLALLMTEEPAASERGEHLKAPAYAHALADAAAGHEILAALARGRLLSNMSHAHGIPSR